MKNISRIKSIVIILILAAGCGSFGPDDDGSSVNTDTLVKDRKYEYSLARFASSTAMETYLKEAIKKQATDSSFSRDILTYTQTNTSTGSMSGQEGMSSSPDRSQAIYSSTILQESGVDEADLVKTDGGYLYMAIKGVPPYYGFGEGVSVVGTTRFAGGSSVGEDLVNHEYSNKIRVMKLSDSPPSATEVAVISLSDSTNIDSLYLVNNRSNGLSDLLAVIGTGDTRTPMAYWFTPGYWRNGKTVLELFNISNPDKPSNIIRLSIDGYLIASRRIGETLYIVSRYTPYIEGYLPYPQTETDKQNNAALLAGASLSQLLPDISINGERKGDLVNPENCYLPPAPKDAAATPDIITITAIDLASPQNPISGCIIGQAEAVYVSTQSLYLATTRYRYVPMPLSGDTTINASNDVGMTVAYLSPEVKTDLHKFSLDASQPHYRGSGVVPGHLGWEQDKKSFRMGEMDGYLRIATSLGETWDLSAQTVLTVLKESESVGDGRLVEVSSLPNDAHPEPIGKPGERLYAARFLGNRAYLVTFRVTDPLYVIDLKDHANPFIAGELKISGYSDFLHPVNENLLLGIGKEAVPDTGNSGWGDGRGAWYQGVKISLFDVHDPANPAEVNSVVLGKRGTDSDALADHHALAYIPSIDGKPARLALPVRLHDTSTGYVSGNPWDYYDWTHTALYLFDIQVKGKPGITLSGKLTAGDRSTGNIYGYGYGNDRALILNDSAHFIHDGRVWSALWSSAEQSTGPR